MKSLKISLLITIIFANAISLLAQENDKAYLLCKYEQTFVEDTNRKQDILKDLGGLEISKNGSRYFSIYNDEMMKQTTEWRKQNGDKFPDMATMSKNNNKFRGASYDKLYKNFATSKLTIIDQIGRDIYSMEEEIPTFNWKILPDTIRILNQVCQKAICTFRGRNYEAWFAEGINISEGPWKFNGLPGLILKIEDSKKEYTFVAISIEKVDYTITPKPSNAQSIAKVKFLSMYKEFKSDPFGYLMNHTSEKNIVPEGVKPPKLNLPYNPIELTEK
jgi:GLPGLI family protein